MAAELSIGGLTISFTKSGSASYGPLVAPTITPTVAGGQWMDTVQAVTTSEVAITMGDASGSGVMFIQNLDATNYVEVRTATGGTKFAKLLAGEWCILRLGSGVTAPFIIADTATCNVRIVHFDA